MIDFIIENKVTFIILVGLILFFILRDVVRSLAEKRVRDRLKADMAASEKRIDSLMDALHKDRLKLRDEMAELDARFSVLKTIEPNPKNPNDAK